MFKGEIDSRIKTMMKQGKTLGIKEIKDHKNLKLTDDFNHYMEEYRPTMSPFYKQTKI
jgi:hypothetical protein